MHEIAQAYIEEENPLLTFKTWDNVIKLFGSIDERADEESLEAYNKLPDDVMVYRGVWTRDAWSPGTGVSWTTDYKVAEMFALRFRPLGGESCVLKGEIQKEDILYFTNARQESEVILNPSDMIWEDTHKEWCLEPNRKESK